MVALVGSSSVCSWDYLGLFVAVKSELRRAATMTNSMWSIRWSLWRQPYIVLRSSPSESVLRRPGRGWLSNGAYLHLSSHWPLWYGLG